VMTPHAGELARLTGGVVADELAPWELARTLASEWGVTLVFKGPFTAIGSDGEVWVHARPNPALATAGTGDVLTGIIGGLLAQGLAPDAAALVGVRAHGEAGAVIAQERGTVGLMASELLDRIPSVLPLS
jgi:NAD(P)H-hydrate epimerase